MTMNRALVLSAVAVFALVGIVWAAEPFILASPSKTGGKSLRECLAARHSTRAFATDALPQGALDQILWAADGINREDGKKRTHPSAFECYPVSVYVVEQARVARYDAAAHALVPIKTAADPLQDFRVAVTGPSAFAKAPALLVISVKLDAFPAKAAPDMRPVWAHAECGAIGQNVSLACADLDLGTVFASAGSPEKIREALDLSANETPAYLMPIGIPAQR
jgi:nitroreductase